MTSYVTVLLQLQPCSPINHRNVQRIVRATSPQSMNIGARCGITDNFRYAIRSHSHATTNQHLHCSKKGKRNIKEEKGKSMMHAL